MIRESFIIQTMLCFTVSIAMASYPASYLICALCVGCEVMDLVDATYMFWGEKSTLNLYHLVVHALFTSTVNFTKCVAFVRFVLVQSTTFVFLDALWRKKDQEQYELGFLFSVLFPLPATLNLFIQVFEKFNTAVDSDTPAREHYHTQQETPSVEHDQMSPSVDTFTANRHNRPVDTFKPDRRNQAVNFVDPCHNNTKSQTSYKPIHGHGNAQAQIGTLLDHEMQMIKTDLSRFIHPCFFPVQSAKMQDDQTRYVVVIIAVQYAKTNDSRTRKLSVGLDIEMICHSFQNKHVQFILLTDDQETRKKCCQWDQLSSGPSNQLGNPTWQQYQAVYHFLAQRTDKFKLITHISAHGADEFHNGGVFLMDSHGGNTIDNIDKDMLEICHRRFVYNRKKTLAKTRDFYVLNWTIVLDICYAKRVIPFPVNFSIEKTSEHGGEHMVVIKRDLKQIISFSHEDVIIVCLCASDEHETTKEVRSKNGLCGEFTMLLYKEFRDISTPSSTLVQLIASLTPHSNPIGLMIEFVHRMDSELAHNRTNAVQWSSNVGIIDSSTTAKICYNESLITRKVRNGIISGDLILQKAR